MNIVRNILAVVLGLVIGGSVNTAIIMIGPMIIPPPAGADVTTVDGLKAAMPLLGPQHFISPFLAHALGTLVGSLWAAYVAASHKLIFSMVIGVMNLIGGIMAATMIPAPMWFIVLDLVVAYIPMAWLGWKLVGRDQKLT